VPKPELKRAGWLGVPGGPVRAAAAFQCPQGPGAAGGNAPPLPTARSTHSKEGAQRHSPFWVVPDLLGHQE